MRITFFLPISVSCALLSVSLAASSDDGKQWACAIARWFSIYTHTPACCVLQVCETLRAEKKAGDLSDTNRPLFQREGNARVHFAFRSNRYVQYL
jgi:hypothetical protein